jgi:hypothetical protein
MSQLSEHPTVKRYHEQSDTGAVKATTEKIGAEWARQLWPDG